MFRSIDERKKGRKAKVIEIVDEQCFSSRYPKNVAFTVHALQVEEVFLVNLDFTACTRVLLSCSLTEVLDK